MTTKVTLIAAPMGSNRFFELLEASQALELEYGGKDSDYEGVGLREGELVYWEESSTFVIEPVPVPELEPCKPVFDTPYTGKCKKLRREARGWR
jgi:hypothetical protein